MIYIILAAGFCI